MPLVVDVRSILKPYYKVPDSASFIIVHVYHLTQETTTATSYHYHYHHLYQQHIATLAPHVCTHLHLLEVETSIDRAERDLLIKLATGMSTDLPTTLPCQVTTGYETRLPCEYCLSFGNMSSHTKLTISSQCVRKPPPKRLESVCLAVVNLDQTRTGASSGIGRAIALLFAHEGAHVVCADLSQRAGGGLEDADSDEGETEPETHLFIRQSGGSSLFVHADVRIARDVENLVRRTVQEFGRLDVYVLQPWRSFHVSATTMSGLRSNEH